MPSFIEEINLRGLWGEGHMSIFNVGELKSQALKSWVVIVFPSLGVAVLVAFYSLFLPNVYRSSVKVVSVDTSGGGLPGALGSLGGVASLAGINLSDGGSRDNKIAKELMVSRGAVLQFLKGHDLVTRLIAGSSWEAESGREKIDSDIYDVKNSSWVGGYFENSIGPTDKAVFESYVGKLKVKDVPDSPVTVISFESFSPIFSQEVLAKLVDWVNANMRDRALLEAQSSIAFLEGELVAAEFSEVKEGIYRLVEEQYKRKMLASATHNYALNILDEAYIPDEKSGPGRTIMVLFSFVFTLFFMSFFEVFRFYVKKMP